MRKLITIGLVLAASAIAHSDAPAVDAVKAALPKWTDAIAVPFTYQGLRYVDDDYNKVAACDKAFGAHGVLKDAKKLPQFVGCVQMSVARDALMGKPDVSFYDPKHRNADLENTADANAGPPLNELQKGYPAKIAKLAKKGGLFVAHAEKPDSVNDYWDQAWNVYVAHTDAGAVKFDAIVVVLSEQSPD
jgi:hypothetical protein